jgi:hypothetical protein
VTETVSKNARAVDETGRRNAFETLEAQPNRVQEVEEFLKSAQPLAQAEQKTVRCPVAGCSFSHSPGV